MRFSLRLPDALSFVAFLLVFFVATGTPFYAFSQDKPPAVPVVEVQAEALAPLPSENKAEIQDPAGENLLLAQATKENPQPIVVELFSTQACSFCPKADALLGELAKVKDVITLSCHVDYFDVKSGSLAHPLCSMRQNGYEETLRAGPKYTPQMVINGRYDVVGYRATDVVTALTRARRDGSVHYLDVRPSDKPGIFLVSLPDFSANASGSFEIQALAYDSAHHVTVSEGANAGKSITYTHVVRGIIHVGVWNGMAQTVRFDPKMSKGAKGFVVLVSHSSDGRIAGAGRYERTQEPAAPAASPAP